MLFIIDTRGYNTALHVCYLYTATLAAWGEYLPFDAVKNFYRNNTCTRHVLDTAQESELFHESWPLSNSPSCWYFVRHVLFLLKKEYNRITVHSSVHLHNSTVSHSRGKKKIKPQEEDEEKNMLGTLQRRETRNHISRGKQMDWSMVILAHSAPADWETGCCGA